MLHIPTSRNGEIRITTYALHTAIQMALHTAIHTALHMAIHTTLHTANMAIHTALHTAIHMALHTAIHTALQLPIFHNCTTHIVLLQKNCDIYVIIIIYTFWHYYSSSCTMAPLAYTYHFLFCTEITLKNLHLSCCFTRG